jgi:hypothetical protein
LQDHDYSPPISTHPTPHPISMDPTASSIPQQQRTQPAVVIDDKQWFYKDPQNTVQGPFSSADMERWFTAGYFTVHLPFRTDVPSLPSSVQQQQSVAPESQKFNLMPYAPSSTANNAYIEEYLMQQQSRQNVPHSMLFNRYIYIVFRKNFYDTFLDKHPYLHQQLIENRLHLHQS